MKNTITLTEVFRMKEGYYKLPKSYLGGLDNLLYSIEGALNALILKGDDFVEVGHPGYSYTVILEINESGVQVERRHKKQ